MPAFDVMTRGGVLDAALQARDYLVTCGVPSALTGRDARLWGRRVEDQRRLGWLDLPFTSHALVEQLRGEAEDIGRRGLDEVVLVGVGAEALAARAVAEAAGGLAGLTVLDGSDPAALEAALTRLDRTLVVLSSKAGVFLEGDAYHRILAAAFRAVGLSEAQVAERFLVITDRDSPLHAYARRRGYRIGLTDRHLPGHFGALSAYGLVPAVLAGADVSGLLDGAAAVVPSLGKDEDNPGLLLGAVLGGSAQPAPGAPTRDKLVLRGGSEALVGWVAQLVATGTGKRGRGILPLEGPAEMSPDVHSVALGTDDTTADTSVWGPPGAQFLLWDYATAVAGWLLGVNPFDGGTEMAQAVEDDAAAMLHQTSGLPVGRPDFLDGGVEVHADPSFGGSVSAAAGVPGAVDALLRAIPASGYLTIVSYLPGDTSVRDLVPSLARWAGRPVSHGPGPGHLHALGSLHKDGPRTGAFLVVSGPVAADREVPGRPYSVGGLLEARALADVRALRRRGLPVLWLRLTDPAMGAGGLRKIFRA